MHRLKELGVTCPLLAECVDDDNRERLLRAGAANVTRPIRAYPGMLVRSLIAPGSETVVEDIFRSGTFDFRRFEVAVTSTPWRKVVRCLLDRDIGTAVAYVLANNGRVVTHPAPDECIEARALLLLVDEDKQVGDEEVRRALGDA